MKSICFFLLIVGLLLAITHADPNPTGGASCKTDKDCGGRDHGSCDPDETLNATVCVCDEKYGDPDCSYKRKNQLTAFLLELILGLFQIMGVGRIYTGYIAIGVIHLLLPIILLVVACIFACCAGAASKSSEGGSAVIGGVGGVIFCLGYLAMIVWFVWDVVLISQTDFLDDKGYSLYYNL